MSALIPLINELLPMIMPAEVHITPAAEIEEAIQTKVNSAANGAAGVMQQGALVNCGSNMCASNSIVFAASGMAVLLTLPDIEADEPSRNVLAPGSFAFIPAWTEHRIVNETGQDVRWTIVQSGSKPIVVDLDGWAGDEVKRPAKNRDAINDQNKKEGWVIVKP